MDESIEVRCTVWRNDHPALYDFISNLPTGTNRKRTALLMLMLSGLQYQRMIDSGFAGISTIQPANVSPAVPSGSIVMADSQPSSSGEVGSAHADFARDLIENFGELGG